jgi:Domain of unknown function(DUF2779)
MREIVNKSDWLAARQCLALGWFGLREQPAPPNEAARFRMEQGQNIGRLAHQLYPDGILISKQDGKSPVELTRELMADSKHQAFFEATFAAAPFSAKADILCRDGHGWHVLEVKSKFANSSGIEALVDDLAYTVFVLRRAGETINKASLVLLSRTYVFGDTTKRLFEVVDKTKEVEERVAKNEQAADGLRQSVFESTQPRARLIPLCRDCDFFADCLGADITHTIFEIPNLSAKKLRRLSVLGIVDLEKIPEDLELNDRQSRVRESARSRKPVIDKAGLRASLEAMKWPCHYLDFETVAPALPLYPGHKCHQQVLTQFSIHRREGISTELKHSEYLADPTKDCGEELAR